MKKKISDKDKIDWFKFITSNDKLYDKDWDCQWDSAEEYTDSNKNGKYDEGEDFVDCQLQSGEDGDTEEICEDDENWLDNMGNGQYDFGEEFVDNGATDGYDPRFDLPEPITPPNEWVQLYFPHQNEGMWENNFNLESQYIYIYIVFYIHLYINYMARNESYK